MKITPLIGFDLDMVLTDFDPAIEVLFNEKFPDLEYKRAKDRPLWEISSNYPIELREEISSIYLNPVSGFYQNLKAKEGAIEAVREIVDWGWDIAIVSTPINVNHLGCPPSLQKIYPYVWTRIVTEKAFWIEKHLGFLPSFIPIKDKTKFAGDFLIDDNPNVGIGKNRIPTWQHLLFDEDYLFNRASKVVKINWSNWREVFGSLEK